MPTLWIVFGLYLVSVLVVGEVCARLKIHSLDDYLLAGRQHGTWLTAGTLAATVVGAGSTLGAAGVAYFVGLSAAWYLLSASVGLVLLALTLAPALRRLSLYTVPAFIEQRYGPRAGLLASVLGVIGLVLFLASQLYAMGVLIAQITELTQLRAIVLSSLVVIVYTWRGGNWAVQWTDSFQLLWIVVGVALAAAAGIEAIGGIESLARPPPAAGFERLGGTWFNPTSLRPVGGWDLFALGNTVLAWIIMSTTWHFAMQSTAQRFLSSRDPGTARNACLAAAALLAPLALMIAVTGMAGRMLYPELPRPAGIEQTAALPALLGGVLSPVWAGVVLAALVAAIMSTCDSVLLGASTVLVKDIYPRFSGESAGESALIRLTQKLTVAVGLVAMGSALLVPTLVRMLEMVAAVYCVALFVPLVLGFYWKGATEKGAILAMATSGLAGLAWRGLGLERETGIHMLNLSLPLSLAALVLGSLLTGKGRG